MSYEALWARVDPPVEGRGMGLWARQMALGPSPEFCLMGPDSFEPPDGLEGVARVLDPVWPKPETDPSA